MINAIIHLARMRWALPVLAMVCLSACHSESQSEKREQARQDWTRLRGDMKYRLATQQFEAGRVNDATVTLEEVIRVDPKNKEACKLLARCRLEQGDLRAASEALDAAVALNDSSGDLSYIRGLIAEQLGRLDQALGHYQTAATVSPSELDYFLAVADTLMALGRLNEARDALDRVADRFDRDPKWLMLHAAVATLQHDDQQAADDYHDAYAVLGDRSRAAERYALALVRLGRCSEALPLLLPLLHHSPGEKSGPPSAGAHPSVATGEANGEEGPPSSVVRAAATCYLKLNRPRDARKLLTDLLERSPEDDRAWWLLAESAIVLNDAATVQECIEQGRPLAPERREWRVAEAFVAIRRGDPAKAAALLDGPSTHGSSDSGVESFVGPR